MAIRRVLVLAVALILGTSGCRWIVRASVDSGGNQANGDSYEVALSADGRFVAFESDASNLVPNDTNADRDVFVRNNRTGAVERVFEGANLVDISEDGRYVAVGDFAACRDLGSRFALFIRDRQSGVTECVSELSVSLVALSATARFVAGSSPSATAVFVLDRNTGQIDTIPVPDGYLPAAGLALSDDGRHVVFGTQPLSCLPPPNPPCLPLAHVFVHDRQTRTTERMPLPPPYAVYSSNPSISGDGRWVAYQITTRDPLDPTGETFLRSVWIYDRHTGVAEPISVFPDGTLVQAHDPARAPDISDDGRFVVFLSGEALDPTSPTFSGEGLYVRDTVESQTTLLNRNMFGVPAPEQLFDHALADDGRYVAFTSLSANLVGNDTNGASDVFLRAIPTPRVESVAPPSVPRGTSATLTIVGDGFAPAPTAGVSGDGVAVTAVTRVSEHELSVAITVGELAPTGARTLFVKNTGTGPGPVAGDTGGCSGCLTIT
jgi:hypothetical protein